MTMMTAYDTTVGGEISLHPNFIDRLHRLGLVLGIQPGDFKDGSSNGN